MKEMMSHYNRVLPLLGIASFVLLSSRLGAVSIVGTKHDLSQTMGAATGGQVCIACHTPHNAQANQLIPLWNHTATNTTFTLYTSVTSKGVMGQPTGFSKACLSCHDGTVALDSFGGKAGSTMIAAGINNMGNDLRDDHPVSFTYDAALATQNPQLVSPASAAFVDAAKTIPLYSGKLECSSCHDAHDNANPPFLRKSNVGSALCLSCHSK